MKRSSISSTALEEAGTWFALLHATDRKEDIPAGFRRWTSLSPQNEAAFEVVTEAWERSSQLTRHPLSLPWQWQRAGYRKGLFRAVTAVAATCAVIAIGAALYIRNIGIYTAVGEQRSFTLEDGSRISLNTDTQVFVNYDKHQRAIELRKGEAFFEVAKQLGRPFVVIAGKKNITALGTSFVVRRDAEHLSVTLMEGKVRVSPEVTLNPGQRITFSEAQPPKIDQPLLEQVVSWRKGRIEMDNTPLSAAAADMNRYSTIKLTVEGSEAVQVLVTGVFRAGDNVSLADTLARTCGLDLLHRSNELILSGTPSANCRR